ncbi:hypothetical protein ACFE04_030208 [Oxalis oulophora]
MPPKRKGGGVGGGGGKTKSFNKSKKASIDEDPFFKSQKKRKTVNDENIESSSDEEDEPVNGEGEGEGEGEEVVEDLETADEKLNRIAKEHVEKVRKLLRKQKEEENEGRSDDDDDDNADVKEGEMDSLVAKFLMKEQMEDSGRATKVIASRIQKPESADEFRVLVKHRQPVTAIALSNDDMKGFSASKDGTILHWDVDSGKGGKYLWPSDEVLKSHGVKDPQGKARKHSKQVLGLAVSPDGRYLASGGLDRHVHLWDTRTGEHIQAFPGHRGPVSCLTFRQGSSELFSGSFDRSIKIWNIEDRSYITTLFGHQSEVLSIDTLRKERLLSVGRDRTMQLFKVPEESRLVFRSRASSLECCSLINNDEYLSGSDDGSIELWGAQKKKPVYTVKNAHALLTAENNNQQIPNAHLENGDDHGPANLNSSSVYSWVSSVAVCRGSDLAASGAGNGCVRLWAIKNETKSLQPLYDLPLVGFVNSLAFAKSGEFLVAGVGQEPRLGRWGRVPEARNGVAIQRLKLS